MSPDTGEAVTRTESDDPGVIRDYLLGPDFELAAFKGQPVTFRDWRRIEEAEVAAALDGRPREKFTSIEAMLTALGR